MLAEYLRKMNTAKTVWSDVMPGIQVCCFSLAHPTDIFPFNDAERRESKRFEVLFCHKGCLILEQSENCCITLGEQDIFLLSDDSSFCCAEVDLSLEGVLVAINAVTAQESLRTLYGLFQELKPDIDAVTQYLKKCKGYICLKHTICSQAVFSVLDNLEESIQGEYCVWKTAEILCLLCKQHQMFTSVQYSVEINDHMAHRVRDMHAYMEQHLNEKLTISSVCNRFYISPTSFKKYFRHIYGQPVHQWLQGKRMEKAAQLLRSSRLTVLQIAQSVGYDGLSQFNETFKRFYSCTPKQYRNASKSVNLQLIPQDEK